MSANLSARAAVTDKTLRAARTAAYPLQVVYLVVSFIALISLCHFVTLGYRYVTRNRVHASRDNPKKNEASLSRLPLAITDSFRAIAFRWTVPLGSSYSLNLAEVGLTMAYIGVVLSWSFVNTTTLTGIKAEPHYYANRVGFIASAQIPIMIALGMRNNIISWLTGVGHDKLNYLHRMSARVICLLSWIHAYGRIDIGLTKDETLSNPWMQWGLGAATTISLMIVLTMRPIRERQYELFLVVHFICAFIFVMGFYFHMKGRELQYYGAWPSMIIWGADRAVRLVQLAVYNFAYINPFASRNSASVTSLNASVEVLSPDFMRLTLRRPEHLFRWRAGQSAVLSFPTVASLESHPFTISSIDDENKKVTFIVRVRSGFTKRLFKVAEPGATYPVFINGPYSSPPVLFGYQTVVLIAGGSGVSFILPLLLDVISRTKRGEQGCQRIVFVWAIRNLQHVQWLEDTLAPALQDLPSSLSVQITFCNTTASASSASSASTDLSTIDKEKWDDDTANTNAEKGIFGANFKSALLDAPFATVVKGRPAVEAILSEEIAQASGRVSINVCGPHGLAEAVREAVRNPRPMDILRGGATVSLHVEAFGS